MTAVDDSIAASTAAIVAPNDDGVFALIVVAVIFLLTDGRRTKVKEKIRQLLLPLLYDDHHNHCPVSIAGGFEILADAWRDFCCSQSASVLFYLKAKKGKAMRGTCFFLN